MLVCVSSHNFAHETAGAARIRHSLFPPLSGGKVYPTTRARSAPRERRSVSRVGSL